MKKILLPYANDINGNLVYIDDAQKGQIIHDVDCEDVRGCWNTESRCHDGVPGNSH